MGMLKGFKDMKNMMAATPGLLEQTSQLSANAQAMQSAQAAQAAPVAQAGPGQHDLGAAAGQHLPTELSEPIAGVDLATFAQISAGLAQFDYDQARIGELAAQRGIDPISWQTAMDGWNARIAASPAVAGQFNAFYTGRA